MFCSAKNNALNFDVSKFFAKCLKIREIKSEERERERETQREREKLKVARH